MSEPENQLAIRALANPVRRRIVELLRDGEVPVNALAEQFDIARPGISRHLRVLREARLVRCRTEHNLRFYSLHPEEMDRLRRSFDAEFRDLWRPQGRTGADDETALAEQVYRHAYEANVAIDIRASPSQVYRHLTDQALFRDWIGKDALNTPVEGGRVEATSAFGARLVGEYLALVPDKFLAIRLLSPLDPEGNLYTVALDVSGAGTRLTLRHFVRDENVARLVTMAWGETWKLLRAHLEPDVRA